MFSSERLEKLLAAAPRRQVKSLLAAFMQDRPTAERVSAVEAVLHQSGQGWRDEIGLWIAGMLEVETLVPEALAKWRPLVRDCMAFFASHFSSHRLAPKIVEQIELPPVTPAEIRLGSLISKTPGLQKLGQVLARTQRLSLSLRRELQKLEDGIADSSAEEIRAIVARHLGASIRAYRVESGDRILSEASVSAILPFTWLNPRTGMREEGVFKVMKPHVPACYAEDLRLLQQLAEHLSSRDYGFASEAVVETLNDVRLLLEGEVDFRREQATLAEVGRVYNRPGAHAPKPIPELCADTITAMTLERGVKVTEAHRRNPVWRRRAATKIVEALVADPIFAAGEEALFHADPHAGNLLYDETANELIVLDWALTGRLTKDERRNLARLIIMMTFRDAAGVRAAIHALSRSAGATAPATEAIVGACVQTFFASLPHACSLGAIDAMRLLDKIGLAGVRFPAALVLIRKVLFTLDGVLRDVAREEVRLDAVVARNFFARWIRQFGWLPHPFGLTDLLAVERSALLYATGLWAWGISPAPALPPAALQ
jgi:ubiquinone biosynthesis protein